MSALNNLQCVALSKLRKDLLKHKFELKHYKRLYKAECDNSKKFIRLLMQCRKEKDKLFSKCESLIQQVHSTDDKPVKRVTRKRKEWTQIKNECTKRRRFAHYKDVIFAALREIQVCHRAEITIWVHENKVQYSWSPNEFSNQTSVNEEQAIGNRPVKKIYHDHNYTCTNDDTLDEVDTYDDVDYCEIYTNKGKWKIEHVRRLVHVLDCFRISHEAYHEIRMVSKGHLPPIWRLADQKKIMSEQIPYMKHPNVSLNNLG